MHRIGIARALTLVLLLPVPLVVPVGAATQGTATELTPPSPGGPLARVVVLDEGSSMGVELTAEAAAIFDSMTCEQQAHYLEVLQAVWMLVSRDTTADITLWRPGGNILGYGPTYELSCTEDGQLQVVTRGGEEAAR